MAGRRTSWHLHLLERERRRSSRITVASLPDQLKSTAAAPENDDDDDNEKGKITIAAECRRSYEAYAESDTGQASKREHDLSVAARTPASSRLLRTEKGGREDGKEDGTDRQQNFGHHRLS